MDWSRRRSWSEARGWETGTLRTCISFERVHIWEYRRVAGVRPGSSLLAISLLSPTRVQEPYAHCIRNLLLELHIVGREHPNRPIPSDPLPPLVAHKLNLCNPPSVNKRCTYPSVKRTREKWSGRTELAFFGCVVGVQGGCGGSCAESA